MIRKEKNGKRRGRGRIAAALAAVLLVSALMGQTSFAAPIELNDDGSVKGGTITILAPENADGSFDGLNSVPLVFDFYKVASAVQERGEGTDSYVSVVGQDAYIFDWDVPDFAALETEYDVLQKAAEDDKLTASAVNEFTQNVAAVILNGTPSAKPQSTTVENFVKDGMEGMPVDAGLYLVIIHGDQEKYIEEAAGTDTPFITCADTSSEQFIFAPILVSVPNRGMKVMADSDQVVAGYDKWAYDVFSDRTSDVSDVWNYNVEITAKVGIKDQNGAIKIEKALTSYETMNNRTDRITFVYDVRGMLNGERVYTNVASIVLSGAGESSYTILYDIPVGAEVTVTERYTGGDYTPTADTVNPQTKTVIAVDPKDADFEDKIVSFSFANEYDEQHWNGGGSVANHFEAEEGKYVDEKSTKTYADNESSGQIPISLFSE